MDIPIIPSGYIAEFIGKDIPEGWRELTKKEYEHYKVEVHPDFPPMNVKAMMPEYVAYKLIIKND